MMSVFKYNQHFVAMMNVINAARLNPPAKGHKHHIIPKCWFKMNNLPVDNSKDNLVLLTVEDHLKVHQLAYLCVKDLEMKSKMGFAIHRLKKGGFTGMFHTDLTKKMISRHNCMHNEEIRNKVRDWNVLNSPSRGKPQSKESNVKRSESKKGQYLTAEAKAKISSFFKGKHRIKIDGKWSWV